MKISTETSINRLNLVLTDYLEKKTDYAIMLTGNWGAGKTHYLKNTFFNTLDETRYKGIIVSLFGVKTIDDIKDRIFLELYPVLQNKYIKASSTIFKALLKSVDISTIAGKGFIATGIENFEQAGKKLNEDKFDFVDLEQLLICFDDLERVDPVLLSGNQILGYINSIVENSNTKVIIVTNEDKIDTPHYKTIKEKTIGNTIHFQQNFHDVFEDILATYTDATSHFINLIKLHETLIYDFFLKKDKQGINYRTLKYMITYIEPVCHFIQSGFAIKELDDKRDEVLKNVLKFCLMVVIEYKHGQISYLEKHGLEKGIDHLLRKMYKLSTPEPESTGDKLIDMYFPDDSYEYYESLYDYLTGGNYFDKEKFRNEIYHNYNITDQNIPEHYKVYQSLATQNLSKLSDEEYQIQTAQLLQNALDGKYTITEYITVFYYVMRLGNILNNNPDELTDQFVSIIRSAVSVHIYHPLLSEHFRGTVDSEYSVYYSKLVDAAKEVNELSKLAAVERFDHNIVAQLKNDFETLFRKILQELNKTYDPITFSNIEPGVFLQIFKESNNSKRSSICLLLRVMYAHERHSFTREDQFFFSGLKDLLEGDSNAHSPVNISGSLIEELYKEVNKQLTNIAFAPKI